MAGIRTARARAAAHAEQEQWAELADLVLIIAREIQFRGYSHPEAVPLTQSEGMVMRYLHAESDAAPSMIAAATGIQRTNLSTVLRALESKDLIERHACKDDARGVRVVLTEHGRTNYTLVRKEWAATVRDAAGGDMTNLSSALSLLAHINNGLTSIRPEGGSRR